MHQKIKLEESKTEQYTKKWVHFLIIRAREAQDNLPWPAWEGELRGQSWNSRRKFRSNSTQKFQYLFPKKRGCLLNRNLKCLIEIKARDSRLTKDFVENGIVRILRGCFLLRTFDIIATFIANVHLDITLRRSSFARWKVEAVFN